jgi:macrolide transport system ATP-binding/permease protein
MNQIALDLKDSLRALRRDLGYTATAVVTLALTIGATTATFSIVNGVLLKPLAYREPHQLVAIREVVVELVSRYPVLPVNGRHFQAWQHGAQTFDALAAYLPMSANLTGAGDPVQIHVVRATGGLLDVLHVRPAIGRPLREDDERRAAADVTVIGDRIWRERFSADHAILGRAIILDGKPYTVVGVLPPGFQLPEAPRLAGPVQLTSKLDAFVPLRVPDDLGWVGDFNYVALGRLKRGVTFERARADLDVIQADVSRRASDEVHQTMTIRASVTPLAEAVTGSARRGLLLLLGATAAVLLIACSNLANLSLTRAAGRLWDATIRMALGASRARIVGRIVLEQGIVSVLGGVAGMAVAWVALRTFVLTAPIELPRVSEVTIDARVTIFAAAVSVVAGMLTAVLPAWRISGGAGQGSLRASGLATTDDRHSLRARGALLALQIALSVMLLVVTALLGASFMRLMRVDRGFSADHVLAVNVSLPSSRYEKASARVSVYDGVLASVRELPGVDAASWTSVLPLKGEDWADLVTAEGDTRPIVERPIANYRFVAPEFFKTLSITIRRGRPFTDADRAADRPAVPALVSEATAARAWPGRDALGLRFQRGSSEKPFEVVGIVSDGRSAAIDSPSPLMVYVPYWFRSRATAALVIHTAADPLTLVAGVRHSIQSVDPEIAVGESRPLMDIVDASFAARRYQMTLFVAFGLVALLIAIVGVYGVTAYGVSRRRREMNIRLALGAQMSQVLGLVVRQTSLPVALGALTGATGALAIGGIVASQLFEVPARDPLIIAAVVVMVGGAGMLTCALAARQGLKINPASALRDE